MWKAFSPGRPNWDPHSSPTGECVPPPPFGSGGGGTHSLAGEGRGVQRRRGDRPCRTLSIYVLYFVAPGLWEMSFIMYSCSPITFFIVRTAVVVYTHEVAPRFIISRRAPRI